MDGRQPIEALNLWKVSAWDQGLPPVGAEEGGKEDKEEWPNTVGPGPAIHVPATSLSSVRSEKPFQSKLSGKECKSGRQKYF